MPYVGKRWVHQVAEYDRERGISYWTKNYRTGIERTDEAALDRRYTYYDPIATLPESGQAWWRERRARPGRGRAARRVVPGRVRRRPPGLIRGGPGVPAAAGGRRSRA